MGKNSAFEFYGATPTNVRWSWAAKRPDGAIVVTLWTDEFDYSTKPPTYAKSRANPENDWRERQGNQEQKRLLADALDHFDGEFFVVINRPRKPISDPRKIEDSFPAKNMRGRIIELDRDKGDFKAVIISAAEAKKLPDI
jgi:hypothetical protein